MMTIEAHSQIADFYKWRPAYAPSFFATAAQKLGLTADSCLLDLCCGRGELASGFSRFCGGVYAVDGSQRMLDNSIAMPGITYLLHDVNNEDISLAKPVDHIVIGSAIHWVEPQSLERLVKRNLKPQGKVLVTHTLMTIQNQPWYRGLANLNATYGKVGASRSVKELGGADRLAACGFSNVDGLRLGGPATFDVEYLYRSQLSYLYGGFYDRVSADLEGYRKRLADTVSAHCNADGKLSGTLVNWGIVYGRVA
ncbi:class I SAM-dependent methyltransferase [Ramlibacter sp. WS9]|uniref:class I SAM-dependent methyltransferase n=1 Tax=Ramlibacter sp. WS9 TaxID=1882741 RepID=UPI00114169D5|nr:class I SAM-dependent methyltransferase [Ramlibacter sp. WS9]ROZ79411.1 class I SAM-dependent methyltransferase [Ramlibacter sp. WS9]